MVATTAAGDTPTWRAVLTWASTSAPGSILKVMKSGYLRLSGHRAAALLRDLETPLPFLEAVSNYVPPVPATALPGLRAGGDSAADVQVA